MSARSMAAGRLVAWMVPAGAMLAMAGCSCEGGVPADGGIDAAARDSGADDSGADDSGADDSGAGDSGAGDSSAELDAGAPADAPAGTDAGTDAGADAGTDAGADAGTDAGADAGTDAGADAGTDAGTDAGPADPCSPLPSGLTTFTRTDSASVGTPDTYFLDVTPGDPFCASITGGGSGSWSVNVSNGTTSGLYCSGEPTCSIVVPPGQTTLLVTAVTTDIGGYILTVRYRPR